MLWLGKKKNNRNTCSVFLDEIKYVAKYGTKKTNGVVGFKRGYSKLSGIDNTSFPSDCNLIEIYKQNSKYSEVKEVEINESMLEFHIRLFRGDFIPALQAVQLDASQTSVKPEHKERYNKLVKQIVEQGADGIIEPVITMKVGEEGKKVIYTATISAKLVKIKSSK